MSEEVDLPHTGLKALRITADWNLFVIFSVKMYVSPPVHEKVDLKGKHLIIATADVIFDFVNC